MPTQLNHSLTAATISGIINKISGGILKPFITILMILSTIVFIWGIIKFIAAAGNPNKKEEGKQIIMWGLIGLFVIAGMWGLATIIQTTFFAGNETIITPGDLPGY